MGAKEARCGRAAPSPPGGESFEASKRLPSGAIAHIRAESAEEYCEIRDALYQADKTADADDAASDNDRRWFKRRPKRRFRLRRRQEGELAMGNPEGRWVVVVKLAEGARARLPMPTALDAALAVNARLPWKQLEPMLRELLDTLWPEEPLIQQLLTSTDKRKTP